MVFHVVSYYLSDMRTRARLRIELAKQMESEIRPLLGESTMHDGYNCCGCSTYDDILDHALRIVRGEP